SARNGEIPKFQKPLFGTTPPSALSGLVVQTFPNGLILVMGMDASAPEGEQNSEHRKAIKRQHQQSLRR
ncbi:hypothetical protein, partial [Xanthomonas phaseoli]|uniref:hypothetical protein n=1 Tax=Xanthomonas phaseoli TaxID=1985254 RepID=UPI0012670E34